MKSRGLIVAMRSEAFALLGRRGWQPAGNFLRRELRLADGTTAACICSGAGLQNAETAADLLMENGATRLVATGTAGGLHPALRPGDLIVADRVYAQHRNGASLVGETAPESSRWPPSQAGPKILRGAVVTCGVVIETPAQKADLYRQTGALAVDMESAAVVRAAARRGVSWLILRAVCDTATESLSREILDTIDMQGRVDVFQLARVLLHRPALGPALLHLNAEFRLALAALKKALPLLF